MTVTGLFTCEQYDAVAKAIEESRRACLDDGVISALDDDNSLFKNQELKQYDDVFNKDIKPPTLQMAEEEIMSCCKLKSAECQP